MRRENVIPITKNWIVNSEVYFILQIFYTNLNWIDYDIARGDFLWFGLQKPLRPGQINRVTWYDKKNLLETLEMPQKEEFLCLMPKDVFKLILDATKKLPTKQRATVIKVFVYLYYNSMWTTNGWYSHSRDDAAADLHMNRTRFSDAVKWLEDRGFLARGNYLIGVETRRYYIPEFLWTEECKRFNERKM